MSIQNFKITDVITTIQSLDDRPQLGTTTALKEKFDHSPETIRQVLNNVIDYLYTYYASKQDLQDITLGQINDGTITPQKLSFDPATQVELDNLVGTLTNLKTTDKSNIVNAINEVLNYTIVYSASSTGNDTFVINPSPAKTSYTNGMTISFKSDVANIGTSTINISGLGSKSIKKVKTTGKSDLDDGDILPNYISVIIYDGTDFILTNPWSGALVAVASNNVAYTSVTTRSTNSNSWTKVADFIVKEPGMYRVKFDYNCPTNTYVDVYCSTGYTNSTQLINALYPNGTTLTYNTGLDIEALRPNSHIYIYAKYNASANTVNISNIKICRDLQDIQGFTTIL